MSDKLMVLEMGGPNKILEEEATIERHSFESGPKNKVLFEFHRNILFDKRMFIQLISVRL